MLIEPIIKELSPVIEKFSPFEATFSGMGGFPNIKNFKVLWAGISKGEEQICLIQRQIENVLSKYNFPKEEKKYTPHITICRLSSIKDKNDLIAKIVDFQKIELGNILAKYITLIQSEPSKSGYKHTRLHQFSLGIR
ncbi:MAG: RNA 2',3'-cyclic phosphodiesterase [Armatimonadetes bacterium]|nr:RNA 2',3'-cyclic phosphodiesterase [Armatimonadota bacterium]